MIRFGLAALLVAGAIVAALLAQDARTIGSTLRNGDVVYAATPSRARWSASTTFGDTAQSLTGADDDIAVRRALQQYVDAAKLHLRLDNAVDVESARGRVQDSLERVARGTPSPRTSQALTLLGILAFRAAATGTSQSQVDVAMSDFADAVRADPANRDAAFDLELLLRLTAAHGTRREPGQGGGFGRTGRRGAGGGQPGSGY